MTADTGCACVSLCLNQYHRSRLYCQLRQQASGGAADRRVAVAASWLYHRFLGSRGIRERGWVRGTNRSRVRPPGTIQAHNKKAEFNSIGCAFVWQ